MELNKMLNQIVNEDLQTKSFSIKLQPTLPQSSMDKEIGSDELTDRDRIEIALEMLYGVKNYVHGLNRTMQCLEDLIECCDAEENDEEGDEFSDNDDDEEDY
jgi:hypothetical protein